MKHLIPRGRKRTSLSPEMATGWAEQAHIIFLDSIMKSSDWSPGELAFHGGTSLHLSWQSTRYSEDLDFLLSRSQENMSKIIQKTTRLLLEHFRRLDPAFDVEVRDKTKDANRMVNLQIVISHPLVVGNTMVKAEFWRTEPNYLASYPTELRTPMAPGDYQSTFSYPVPAATLETAFADKLVAFATRPHLKWRDIYDLWWISTQSGTEIDLDRICDQFEHNITAYNIIDGLDPKTALVRFLDRDRNEVIQLADPDLKTWLPADLWKALYPKGVVQMVDFTRQTLCEVYDVLDSRDRTERHGVPRP